MIYSLVTKVKKRTAQVRASIILKRIKSASFVCSALYAIIQAISLAYVYSIPLMLLPRVSRVRISRKSKIRFAAVPVVGNRRYALSLCFCRACTCQELRRSCVCDTRRAQLHIAYDGNGVPYCRRFRRRRIQPVSATRSQAPIEMTSLGFILFRDESDQNRSRIGRPPDDFPCLNN